MMTPAQRDLLESIANNSRTLNDVRNAIGAALSNDPATAPPVNADGIKESAEVALMYLQTGLVGCPQCGEEVPTKDLDAAYELATVVQPAPTIGGTVRTYPVPEGMKPWTGGDSAPDDWDGGSVLRADGQIEHSDDITIQQWKHPVPRCKWNVVAYTPARVLELPEPVFSTNQAVKWRERWYGSEPQKGSAIVDERGNLIAYFGGDETTHKATTAAVFAHNAALDARPATSQQDARGDFGVGQDELVAGLKRALQHPAGDHDGWTDAGMEDAFFRWPGIVNALNEALASNRTATSQEGPCILCAGKCRGHGLADPVAWEPEVGSVAAIARAKNDDQRVVRTERADVLCVAMREINEMAVGVGDIFPNDATAVTAIQQTASNALDVFDAGIVGDAKAYVEAMEIVAKDPVAALSRLASVPCTSAER
jgi:hypothetical protein